MKRSNRKLILITLSVSVLGLLSCSENSSSSDVPLKNVSLGGVNFPTSCTDEAAPLVERGVALLHNMMYEPARLTFIRASDIDPECAIAHWGHGMTLFHPLWPDQPNPEDLELGNRLVETALSSGSPNARELAYISTIAAYFDDGSNKSESARLTAFSNAWTEVHENYPEDQEATAFYALSQLTQASPADKSYRIQNEVGPLLERILESSADHLGAHHYIIHAYDFPPLADRALEVARNYVVVGPNVTHALHMSTHIFTLLGLWNEVIENNIRASETALTLSEEIGELSIHYTHAQDYLAYGYLQLGMDAEAEAVLDNLTSLPQPIQSSNRAAVVYAFSAVPARLAMERRDWDRAITLQPPTHDTFGWDAKAYPRDDLYPFVAPTHFARGMGFANLGLYQEAEAEIALIQMMENQLDSWSTYWKNELTIQRLSLEAWVALRKGDTSIAISTMQDAVSLESSSYKHGLYPNEVIHASELLGDMLLESESFSEAISAYEISLSRSPNRLNSLSGIAQAAEKNGDLDMATRYYRDVVELTQEATSELPQIKNARLYLDKVGAE